MTEGHPSQFLNAQNASWYARGHVQNPRKGETLENGDVTIVGDLVITDAELIEKIKSGLRQLSCGYQYDLCQTSKDEFEMTNLRGNHVALVQQGRGEPQVRIVDAEHLVENLDMMARKYRGKIHRSASGQNHAKARTMLFRSQVTP